jgi:pullulanase/glycogen debranching enzyme
MTPAPARARVRARFLAWLIACMVVTVVAGCGVPAGPGATPPDAGAPHRDDGGDPVRASDGPTVVAADAPAGLDATAGDDVIVAPDAALADRVGADAFATDLTPPPDTTAASGDAGPSGWDVYAGRLLGARLLDASTVEFSLFAPRASTVQVVGDFNGWSTDTAAPLVADPTAPGIFAARLTIPGAAGQHYHFLIDGRPAADPYARVNQQNRGDSVIVDPVYTGWTDQAFQRPAKGQLVIYEMHLSDYTYDASSGVDPDRRGRFPGMQDRIDHLQRLGVNAVELMPIHESQSDGYTWGYNPGGLYFAPETSLAMGQPTDGMRQLQSLVDALHAAGIAVILDVVYNHVAGQTRVNHLWDVDPLYYFDDDDNGDPGNDVTPWGYRLTASRPMVKKLLYDSMRYLMDVYHVDGFRLDSTENMNLGAVAEVVQTLAGDGYADRYFIFEEWNADHNQRLRQLNQQAGRALISSWGGGAGFRDSLWQALFSGRSQRSLGDVTWFSSVDGWHYPAEVVNYLSSHDEGTLAARWSASQDQVRLGMTHLLTAPGLPMFWMGDEMMRLQYGNHHPSGDNLSRAHNLFDWTLAQTNGALVDFVGALVRLRLAHPALRLPTSELLHAHFGWTVVDWHQAIGWIVRGVSGDHDFVVLVNYRSTAVDFSVSFPRTGRWRVMVDGDQATADPAGLEVRTVPSSPSSVHVEAGSALILMSEPSN